MKRKERAKGAALWAGVCRRMAVLLLLLSFLMPSGVYATGTGTEAELTYIFDAAGLFTEEQHQKLQEQAASVAGYSQCGVYFVAVNDYNEYSRSGDVQIAAEDIYLANGFGLGEEKNGVMLLLSMNERDYALIAYGTFAHTAFTDYGKEMMSENFLDDFADDHWYSGCLDYLLDCQKLTELAMAGTPFDVEETAGSVYDEYYDGYYDDGYYDGYYNKSGNKGGGFLSILVMALLPSSVVSMAICIILRRQMKTARKKTEATDYVVDGAVNFRTKQDMFTHATHTRRKIQTNSGPKSSGGGNRGGGNRARSGGTRVRSSGFSGRKGKF